MENSLTILHHLSLSFLFCGLDTPQLQKLALLARVKIFKQGHVLIEESVMNDKIFVILEGLVKVYKVTRGGKEVFLAVEKTGDYLGIMDLANKPASATIETLRPTKTLVLHKKDLVSLLDADPLLWQKMYKIILAKLEEYRVLQTITLSNDLKERTYLFLQHLARFFPKNTIPLSHEHIAHIVWATRPRVTEVLNKLQEEKKLVLSPKKITLI